MILRLRNKIFIAIDKLIDEASSVDGIPKQLDLTFKEGIELLTELTDPEVCAKYEHRIEVTENKNKIQKNWLSTWIKQFSDDQKRIGFLERTKKDVEIYYAGILLVFTKSLLHKPKPPSGRISKEGEVPENWKV